MMALWLPSGNRDEQTFDDPYRFDIERTPNEQIAFGQGEHFCAGAHLARLELRLMMHALVHEVEQIELADRSNASAQIWSPHQAYAGPLQAHAGRGGVTTTDD